MRFDWLWNPRRTLDVETGAPASGAGAPPRLEQLGLNRPAGAAAADPLNDFATRMLAAVPVAETQAMSPHNLALALAMVAQGAGTHTLAELQAALAIGGQPGALDTFAARLQAAPDEALPDRLESAAAVWPDCTLALHPAFLADMRSTYRAEISALDFGDREGVAAIVNRWAHAHTGGHIDTIVSADAVPRPPGVLVSTAFFFQGTWVTRFDRAKTVRAPFHAPDGDVPVWLMQRTSELSYAETSELQVVELPYRGGCALTVILPKAGRSLSDVIAQIGQPGHLQALLSQAYPQLVRLALPRIDIDSGVVSMTRALRTLGVESLFGPHADLSRMTPMTPGHVSEVAHRATLAVDEEGTVATAATIAVARCASPLREKPPKPIEMRVDRPYLMLLQQCRDGAILFAATVTRPRSV